MVVVVVVAISVGGISSLPRRKAVFFLSHAVRFHIFTFPAQPISVQLGNKKGGFFSGALDNGVERNVKRR